MSKTKPWQWVALGCAGLVVLTLATAAFFTALYWPKLQTGYQRAKASVTDMVHVTTMLQRQYGGHVAFAANRQSGVDGTTLHITLTNPTFLSQGDPGEQALHDKALEIAAAVHGALTTRSWYANYEVEFVRNDSAAAGASRSWSYRFRASELPPAKNNPE
jgi:hypothetical protein